MGAILRTLWVQLTGLLAHHTTDRDRGAGLVEYVLLVSLIALACMGALTYFGGESGGSLTNSSASIVGAG